MNLNSKFYSPHLSAPLVIVYIVLLLLFTFEKENVEKEKVRGSV